MDSSIYDLSHVLIELGLVVIGLAILARIASRWGFSAIPLYLLAGLAFGKGGLAPLNLSAGFTHIGAEIGVLLLLFMLGLEYTGAEVVANARPPCGTPPKVEAARCSPVRRRDLRLFLRRDCQSLGRTPAAQQSRDSGRAVDLGAGGLDHGRLFASR